jgi:APA family basic amino acid/polyamine antiporter
VLFVGLTAAGLFVIRNKSRACGTAILTPGYPVTPIVFLTFIALTLVVLALHAPRESALGVAVVLAGVPAYQVFQRAQTRPAVPQVPAEEVGG